MEPTLLIGDRIFVSKYTYGFSKHSFPFSPPIYNSRFFYNEPRRGDLIVFKTPIDNRTDYIKRLIGLPGDTIEFLEGNLLINGKIVQREMVNSKYKNRCGPYKFDFNYYKEKLPNGTEYLIAYKKENTFDVKNKYEVPNESYFLMGDNRDCSNDSRIGLGFVPKINLVGKAQIVFFSNDTKKNSLLKFWNWHESIRTDRFFKKLK
tara:strand:+ start:166 stop:780 length:615 start_codon:yes stop_codon:yes gene_type:complete